MKTTVVYEQWLIGGVPEHELPELHAETAAHKGHQIPRPVVLQVAGIVERVASVARGFINEDESRLRLVEELVINGITHGNGGDVTRQVRVKLVMTLDRSSQDHPVVHTAIDVDDEGPALINGKPAFSIDAEIAEALDFSNLERDNGRGLLMVRDVMHTQLSGPLPIEGRPGKRMTAKRTDPLKPEAQTSAEDDA